MRQRCWFLSTNSELQRISAVIEIILSLSENVYLASRRLFRRMSARTFLRGANTACALCRPRSKD
jgi:hypothetical protein